MSKSVPKADEANLGLDAQCLVMRGYKTQRRQRVYLVKLEPDGANKDPVTAVGNWEKSGRLSAAIFADLLAQWACSGNCSKFNRINTNNPIGPVLPYQVDIGITFPGLESLGVPVHILDVLRQKTPAFTKGAYFRAARHLGDTGPSDPKNWPAPYNGNGLHALLFVHSSANDEGFREFEASVLKGILTKRAAGPCSVVHNLPLVESDWVENSEWLDPDNDKIHFGFLDGISTPVFDTFKPFVKRELNAHQLGELLLGHPKNDGSNAWCVPKVSHQEGTRVHAAKATENEAGSFFRNGSFGAFRKMAQATTLFENYLAIESARFPGEPAYVKEWLKAKMLGRWANGEVVEADQLPPEGRGLTSEEQARMKNAIPRGSDGNNKPLNDFDFSGDIEGHGCPFGAHIRRMNPRKDAVTPFIPRPLLRRGVPYGDPNTSDKGLLGLFLCASLEEQFEHLLGSWADNNPVGMPFESAGKDPIIGNHEQDNAFEIPMSEAAATHLGKMDAFVKTVGTSYIFFPSLSALHALGKICPVATASTSNH